jgi:hypothetical protein
MAHYHYVTRTSQAQQTQETHVECPDDETAIEHARRALIQATRDAALQRRLLDEEIEIRNALGDLVARVACDGTKH